MIMVLGATACFLVARDAYPIDPLMEGIVTIRQTPVVQKSERDLMLYDLSVTANKLYDAISQSVESHKPK